MPLRRAVIAALALAVLGPIVPAAAVFRSAEAGPEITRLPRPDNSREVRKQGHDPHTVLVRFEAAATAAARDRALTSRGATMAGRVPGGRFVKVRTTGEAAALARDLARDPAVDMATLDFHRYPAATPNDPIYAEGSQKYLATVRLPAAWNLVRDARTQVIAVVDTGVDTLHPDLVGRTVTGYNAVNPAAAPTDFNPRYYPAFGGHGTMVAGVAAANTNNGVGIAGAAWYGRIMPVKVFQSTGIALDSDIAEGIVWAANKGAKIVNLSLGGPAGSPALLDAILYAKTKGALTVVASGNDGDNVPQYPAAYPDVLAVGATDVAGVLTDFSSWGDWLDVAAPGFDIVSTYPTVSGYHYAIWSGTSFAAPMASGVAALVRTRYPTLTPADVIARLRATARDAGPRGIDPYYGRGVLDAYHAAGGPWGAEFAQLAPSPSEPNDVPARATAMTTSASGTTGIEGDVDWYRFESDAPKTIEVRVTPPSFNARLPQNLDPMLAVYDSQLRLLDEVDDRPSGGVERTAITVAAGTHYIAVRNYNGGREPRAYSVTVGSAPAQPAAPPGGQAWVRDLTPADFATGVAVTATPQVGFQRVLDPASVDATTVRLVQGRSGSTVPATPSYVAETNTVTLRPAAPLLDNTPYRIVVGAVRDQAGQTHAGPYSATFRTADAAPPAVRNFTATGAYKAAKLTWALPAMTDLDRVIVRMAAGTVPPSSPTAGTAVYSGTSTSVRVTGLVPGTTYSFRAWVRDRSAKLSPPAAATLVGTGATLAASPTALTFGATVTVTGRLVRRDTGAGIANAPVQLYGRRKGATTWTLLGTATSVSTGGLRFAHKPSWSLDYMWKYNGSTLYTGVQSGIAAVGVRPLVTAVPSRTSFLLGGSATVSGSVTPNHAGATVYLQRVVSGSWTNVASRTLSSTSTYSFTVKPAGRGTYTYRVYRPADPDNLAGASPSMVFNVT